MIQAVLPHMRAAHSGHIINITSLVGFQGMPFSDAYSASKFAVRCPSVIKLFLCLTLQNVAIE